MWKLEEEFPALIAGAESNPNSDSARLLALLSKADSAARHAEHQTAGIDNQKRVRSRDSDITPFLRQG